MAIDHIVKETRLVAVLQISDQARDQAAELLQLVDRVGEGRPSAELQAELAKEQKHLFTSISHLRGLHRNACLSARETKAATAEARQEVDRLHLQLQNLYYEQRHLQNEIAACESYEYDLASVYQNWLMERERYHADATDSHKYQQLPLIPVEQFLAEYPDHANDQDNDLMVARIDHERTEREALEQQRQELLKRKQKMIADNKRRKDDLANLDKDLEKFIDVCTLTSTNLVMLRANFPLFSFFRRRNLSSNSSKRHPESLLEAAAAHNAIRSDGYDLGACLGWPSDLGEAPSTNDIGYLWRE